jgi:hypothetical protein
MANITINDLPAKEKAKITKLAEKVLELNAKIDELNRLNEQQRMHHAEEIRSIHSTIEGQVSIIEDRIKLKDATISKLEEKEKMITSMLALYQAKLKNMADLCRLAGDNEEYNKKKVTQFQADIDHFQIIIQNQKKLIESFDSTKDQTEERLKSIEIRHSKRVHTLEEMLAEESDRRLRAEKLNLLQSSEIVFMKAEIQQLHYKLQQSRAMHNMSTENEAIIPHIRKLQNDSKSGATGMEEIPHSNSTDLTHARRTSSQDEETNPFKKYGPYDEYSLLFNNSHGEENILPSPTLNRVSLKHASTDGIDVNTSTEMSPISTPATTRIPFDSANSEARNNNANEFSSSRALISQAEQLLQRSRTVQLGVTSPPPMPPPAPILDEPPIESVKSISSHSLPVLKPSVRDPLDIRFRTLPPAPESVTSNSMPLVPGFLRQSKDSIISSVGHTEDSFLQESIGVESLRSVEVNRFHTSGIAKEEDVLDQALLGEHFDEMKASRNESFLSTSSATLPVSTTSLSAKSKSSKQQRNELKSVASNSELKQIPAPTSKRNLEETIRPDNFVSKVASSNISMTESIAVSSTHQSKSSTKAFYEMRALEDRSPTEKKKKSKFKPTTEVGIAIAYPDNNDQSPKKKAKSAKGSKNANVSFASQESKDALSLLHAQMSTPLKHHDKNTAAVHASKEPISYLARPPSQKAQKHSIGAQKASVYTDFSSIKPLPKAPTIIKHQTVNSNGSNNQKLTRATTNTNVPKSSKKKFQDRKYESSLLDLVDALEEAEGMLREESEEDSEDSGSA